MVVPAHALLAMALGKVNLLLEPVPAWNPAAWNPGSVSKAFSGALPRRRVLAGSAQHAAVRGRVARAVLRDRLPGDHHVARHAKRSKTLLIVLMVIPFWVSYLLRMLAWIGLLASDGYVNKLMIDIGIAHPPTGSTATPTR